MNAKPRSKRWILPLVLVLVWLFVGGPLGSFAGALAEEQENDNAAFLPNSAESTEALDELLAFQDTESIPTTIVAERTDGLTPDDLAVIDGLTQQLIEVEPVLPGSVRGPIPAEDGTASQVVFELGTSNGDLILEAVEEMRGIIGDAEESGEIPDGLTVLVGGQGGIQADFVEVFGEIDGLLLLVALAVVLVILVSVYRTPVLPILVLFSAVLGLGVASAAVYALAVNDALDLNGQSQAILFILTIGAATDYALLLVARFREELKDHESKYDAMRSAIRGVIEPVLASGVTVILGLMCLLLSDLSSNAGLGPVGSIGIVGSMLASLTFLPAVLVLLGRRAFWPVIPRYGDPHKDEQGIWGRVANLIKTKSTQVAVATGVVLAIFGGFAFTLNEDPVAQTELFLTEVDSKNAQEILDEHFEEDFSSPAQILLATDQIPDAIEVIADTDGMAIAPGSKSPDVFVIDENGAPAPAAPGVQPLSIDGRSVLFAGFADPADSAPASETLERLRENLDAVSEDAIVGGITAILQDTRDTATRDRIVVIPAILLVILVVLALLLRSIVAPVLLVLANVLSFGATIGVSALLFNYVFDFPASDPGTLLIAFVFLVALGIDYSIFLMTRVREESLERGTRPGILKGLRVTGGVITSAGVVLAATFAALGVLPIVFLVQIAFIVAFGVLLDTIVVRSLLVPAIAYRLDSKTWWPSRLSHADDTGSDDERPTHTVAAGG